MKLSTIHKLSGWSWALVWFMLPVSMQGTVWAIWLFGLSVVISQFKKRSFPGAGPMATAVLFMLYFLTQAVSLFLDPDHGGWIKIIERKAAFLVIPLLLMAVHDRAWDKEKWAIRGFLAGLVTTGVYLTVHAVLESLSGFDPEDWSYHSFANPGYLGAVYFSWYLSAAILYLSFRKLENGMRPFRIVILLFLLFLLLLSSSKLFILTTLPVMLWKLAADRISRRRKLLTLSGVVILILVFSYPFMNRLSELKNTSLKLVEQPVYAYDTPFNGITIRLVQWRFGLEILEENHGWLTGVGLISKQELLNNKYRDYGVYTGNPELGDTGYLDYNFHNQFMESMVGTGLPGLLTLMLIIINIFVRAGHRLVFPLPVYVLTVLFFCTESVLERQAGIMFFCLIASTWTDTLLTQRQTVGSLTK